MITEALNNVKIYSDEVRPRMTCRDLAVKSTGLKLWVC